jgi:hypothetical protein
LTASKEALCGWTFEDNSEACGIWLGSLAVESNSHRGCGRMRYHAFLSHNQMEASGDVTLLCRELEALGLDLWRDMSQLNITEEGMKQGVFDSDVFILVLTNSVLSPEFCLKELSWALAFG